MLTSREIFKDYKYEGKTMALTMSKMKGVEEAYPFKSLEVPVKVVKELPRFFVCEVLPHFNPCGLCSAKSTLYIITLSKFGLYSREYTLVAQE